MNVGALLPIGYGSMHGAGGAGWMVAMMGFMVLFWGAIIVGIIWVARGASARSSSGRKQTPSQILDERFAEGVLSVDDYNARKEVLSGAMPAPRGT